MERRARRASADSVLVEPGRDDLVPGAMVACGSCLTSGDDGATLAQERDERADEAGRGDEQHDEGLQHHRQGERGLRDALHRQPAGVQAAEQQPANTMPTGRERPSSATVIASKPTEPTMPWLSGVGTPLAAGPIATWTPARPASMAPAMVIVMMVVRATSMPAVAAACGLAPTARIAKPIVERSMQPPDADRRQQRHEEAHVELAEDAGERGGGVHLGRDRVLAARPQEGRRGEKPREDAHRRCS